MKFTLEDTKSDGVVLVNPSTGNPDKRLKLGALKRWQPKEWTPVHEQMVALSCANYSNIAISEIFKCTAQHVSNVINCDHAKVLRRKILDNLSEKVNTGIAERVVNLSDKAAQRVYDVINDDELFKESPFSVFDRALKILEANKHIAPTGTPAGINVNKAIILSGEASKQLTDGLAKANEAAVLHGNVEVMTRKTA